MMNNAATNAVLKSMMANILSTFGEITPSYITSYRKWYKSRHKSTIILSSFARTITLYAQTVCHFYFEIMIAAIKVQYFML